MFQVDKLLIALDGFSESVFIEIGSRGQVKNMI